MKKGETNNSIESAKAFLEKIKTDEDFRNSVGAIATKEQRTEFVKNAGFDFTKEEVDTVTSELSDELLDMVAGGYTPCGTGGKWFLQVVM